MKLPHYEYKINENFLDYEFTSEGPKGSIKKIGRFTKIGRHIFNLCLGDLSENTGEINDKITTNNKDSYKVLSTVAVIVHDFSARFPEAIVVATGNSPSRNR